MTTLVASSTIVTCFPIVVSSIVCLVVSHTLVTVHTLIAIHILVAVYSLVYNPTLFVETVFNVWFIIVGRPLLAISPDSVCGSNSLAIV